MSCSRLVRACALRHWYTRREATVITHRRGFSGNAGGPLPRGVQQRLLHRIRGGVEVPGAAHESG
jgi:hypothetical protein